MQVSAAYLAVILIWSTTPLAVQWSSESAPLFSVAMRMLIGVLGCWLLARILRVHVPFGRQQAPIYLVAGVSLFATMSLVYLAANYIPSGWISVLFGLSPIVTGVCARIFLNERSLSWNKVLGMLLGLVGLALVFISGARFSDDAVLGIVLLLASVIMTGAASVWIKHLTADSGVNGLQTNIGGLTVAVPLFVLSWLLFSDHLLPNVAEHEIIGMVYLGLIGTTLGFSLYYFLLRNMEATRVALIALITPITALLLGSWLNGEPVLLNVWLGTALICSGLISFELQARPSWLSLRVYKRQG